MPTQNQLLSYELTRSMDQFSSLAKELELKWDQNGIHSLLSQLNRAPFYTQVSHLFHDTPMVSRLSQLQAEDVPNWKSKLIRRFSTRSFDKESATPSGAPSRTLSHAEPSNLLRRMTWNRSRTSLTPSAAGKLATEKKPSLLTRIGSFRHLPSQPPLTKRPPLMRSLTTKQPAVAKDSVEVEVNLEHQACFRLAVGYPHWNFATPAQSLLLFYNSGGRDISLTARNIGNFFLLLAPHRVWVRFNHKFDARLSWLDLDTPTFPKSQRHSRTCEDVAPAKPHGFSYREAQQLESLEDYLRTPCQTEAQNIMSNRMWDATPELQLSVSSSSTSPNQLSPALATDDFALLVSQAFSEPAAKPRNASKVQRHRTHFIPRPPLQRCMTQNPPVAAMPKRVATLNQPPLIRQNSAPTKLDVSTLANRRSNRVRLTVSINKDFIIKLDLPDYHQTTYTALRNRIATKFSNAGYPLRSLANMTLTHCRFNHPTDPTVPITDTKSLLGVLHRAIDTSNPSVALLLVPTKLLVKDEMSQLRAGIRWDHPLDLARVGS
ncbi:hypothetical protein L0F63_003359 [Massospora cicadina]|nr:hypothetical protein L0F63_003359 [Massospora cicadina]